MKILSQISGLTKETLADQHQHKAEAARSRAAKYLAEGKTWEHKQAMETARKESQLAANFRRMAAKELAR